MDPLGGFSSLSVAVGSFLSPLNTRSQKRDFLYDIRESVWSNRTSLNCFLRVFDLPLSGGHGSCIATTTTFNEIETLLADIPPLTPNTIRVYFEDLPNRTAFDAHLQSHGLTLPKLNTMERLEKSSSLSDSLANLLDSLPDLLAQGTSRPRRLELQSLMLAAQAESLAPSLLSSFLKGKPIIPQIDYLLIGFYAIIQDEDRAISKCRSCNKILVAFIALASLVLISSSSFISLHHEASAQHQANVSSFINRLNKYCGLIPDIHLRIKPKVDLPDAVNAHVQLLLLHYLYFNVSQFGYLMRTVSRNLTEKQDQFLDPSTTTFTQPILNEITSDTRLWEQVCAFSRLNTELLESLADFLSATADNWMIDQQAFRTLRTEIRLFCSAQGVLASHITQRFERIVRDFELCRGIQDSSSTWLLTLLASIFIPMSLATGILSMQIRFADLHFLLYDFVGVVTIIGTIAILIFTVLKATVWGADQIAKTRTRSETLHRLFRGAQPIFITGVSLVLLFLWALMFFPLMVGMISDVNLSLRILGFGSAAYFGIAVVCSGLTILLAG